ncbi:acyl-CoA-like ligand-binding transcription factor [Amycolatopsis sp. CA-230715]|uniref:acyl-CoA-like ligand-binding transcription factor n=1 Tax=Amycolatopsis sp. CA-230715 TaxID=2745196 RepID=UPI001C02FC11|nr:TetR family transcriptional regulator [Amycolatopsis sp. CA-230715]QWF82920.1 hypothetical protein HUW46_06359 [Amycolatopsis sp. CA-230715]
MSTEGLRERKKRETRIALSWAAVRLVVERGVANVKVEDIAAEAGVSLRTFRNYFANKAEAIAARHLDRALEIAEELRLRPADEPLWTAIATAVEDRFPLGVEQGGEEPPDQQWVDGVRLMVAEPSLRGELLRANATAETAMAAAIAERTGTDATKDLYPKLVAAAVGAAITATMQHWLVSDRPLAMKPLLRDALAQFAAGLPEPK